MDFRMVFDSQLNNSISKQMYSFPRAPRFTKRPVNRSSGLNNIERSTLTDRSVSFTRAHRLQAAQMSTLPGPGEYKIPCQFMPQKQRGYVFGRQKRLRQSNNRPSPGPSSYYTLLEHSQGGYSFGKETSHTLQGLKDTNNPEKIREIPKDLSSTICSSKFRNPKFGTIGAARRFSPKRASTPGPGQYNQMYELEAKHPRNSAVSFTRSQRLRDCRATSPGPSDYNCFSEFARLNKSSLLT